MTDRLFSNGSWVDSDYNERHSYPHRWNDCHFPHTESTPQGPNDDWQSDISFDTYDDACDSAEDDFTPEEIEQIETETNMLRQQTIQDEPQVQYETRRASTLQEDVAEWATLSSADFERRGVVAQAPPSMQSRVPNPEEWIRNMQDYEQD